MPESKPKLTADMSDLRPGQQRILRRFADGNHDVVFIPHDVFEVRICEALAGRQLLAPFHHEEGPVYELTPAGRAALNEGGDR